jgi:hypothetical protein
MKVKTIILLSLCIFDLKMRADTLGTQHGSLMARLSSRIESYVKEHNGRYPENLDAFQNVNDFEQAGSISDYVIYFPTARPPWRESGMIADGEIVAISSYAINEDRRPTIGRYMVVRLSYGAFQSQWRDEKTIQAALTKAGITVPTVPVFQERPLIPASLEYAATLLSDALAHGVSRAEAGKVIDQHIDNALAGRVKTAKTWAEIANNPPPQATAANQTPPAAVAVPPSSLKWPALAAAVLAALALGWRFLRRK